MTSRIQRRLSRPPFLLLAGLTLVAATSCATAGAIATVATATGKTGSADPGAAGAPREFAIGADISWVQEQEDAGLRFTDEGRQDDLLAILARHGFDWIRLRIFVDPSAPGGYSPVGYCDLDHTLIMAGRVHAAGLRLLLDFHYSDTWADPGHQDKPAAWRDLHGPALAWALQEHTRSVLAALRDQGTPPDMVQIGNEISNGFLWPDGEVWVNGDWDGFAALLKAAVRGVREVDAGVPVMLHLADGGRNDTARAVLDPLLARAVPFDVIGVSYYPRWHGTLADLAGNLDDLAVRYERPVAVVEYSAPDLREVNEVVGRVPGGRGLGAFIWEPTRWQGGVLFDDEGISRPALRDYRGIAADLRRPGGPSPGRRSP